MFKIFLNCTTISMFNDFLHYAREKTDTNVNKKKWTIMLL